MASREQQGRQVMLCGVSPAQEQALSPSQPSLPKLGWLPSEPGRAPGTLVELSRSPSLHLSQQVAS